MPTSEEVQRVFQDAGGNVSEAARRLGLARSTVQYHLRKVGAPRPVFDGRVHVEEHASWDLPPEGSVYRYLFTSAQNNTAVNNRVMDALEMLAAHYSAEIHISRFSYNKMLYQQKDLKPDTGEDFDNLWYDPRVLDYLSDERAQVAPGLQWCGEMNILPTAQRPLSGFETYTGRSSGIFPHAKFALESIASGKGEPTKLNMTTGTVTQRNYLQRKAGLRAEHHHCYGALLVEVDSAGRWWARQINSTESGEIYDLDIRIKSGVLTTGNRVEAITWGDVHSAQVDQSVLDACWTQGGMMDVLRPRYQFLHDVFDMHSRNHHERGNPHRMFERFVNGVDSVEEELAHTARILGFVSRPWCKTVVVNSNHDNALERWLREADYRHDPLNALFFLEAQLEKYRGLAKGSSTSILPWALRRARAPETTLFLEEDESFVICPDAHGGIECGMHGHLGINGARSSPLGLSRMGRKANTGHTHSAAIIDGMYVAGTSSLLDMSYNRGPSSWSHSHIVTYPNGKRSIITITDGRWRA